ncbi:MAG: phosphoribosyltransferase family protein [Flavobacteriales bacterium]|jgi:pyrimidine operon attenuation protein/uracil phosphoribosyltransferase|tara:strand:- start:12900 stop:13403 length:504 start_codon:yes stop_codon:yes gene_type:complete
MKEKINILNINQVNQKINRLAWQVYENNFQQKEIVLIGIDKKGLFLAEKISECLNEISKIKTIVAELSIDKSLDVNSSMSLNISDDIFTDKAVIIVDDVLNSGKTLMYASKLFLNTTLKKLSILVLIDRNHNLFPIKADFIGLSLSTTLKEYITVDLFGDNKGVYLS